jgi:phosphonate transport system substrate-binding protein
MKNLLSTLLRILVPFVMIASSAQAEEKEWSFGVINQRSITLTAQYWNPILNYVSEKSGVRLTLKMAKTAQESSEMIGRGEFDFVYSNHIFNPSNTLVGYRIFARSVESTIRGEIVTLEDSPIRSLKDLQGREVGFPSPAAFVAYAVTMDALLKAGVTVKPVFSGNQEGTMGQLKAGHVVAASVNSQVMKDFASRENVRYRVVWSSEDYLNIPISAHPRVPKSTVAAVRRVFVAMAQDPEGLKILEASAAFVGQKPPFGFLRATAKEYKNQRAFYRNTLLKELRR